MLKRPPLALQDVPLQEFLHPVLVQSLLGSTVSLRGLAGTSRVQPLQPASWSGRSPLCIRLWRRRGHHSRSRQDLSRPQRPAGTSFATQECRVRASTPPLPTTTHGRGLERPRGRRPRTALDALISRPRSVPDLCRVRAWSAIQVPRCCSWMPDRQQLRKYPRRHRWSVPQ